MTLFKQLVIGLFSLFFLLTTSIFITQYNSASDFIAEQQNKNINNLSHTVEIAILPYIETGEDDVIVDIAKSLYEQGYHGYIKIQFENQETPLLEHSSDVNHNIPDWFKNLANMEPTLVTSDIISQNNYPLTLTLANSTDASTLMLWKAAKNLLVNFSIFVITCGFLIILLVRHILEPIKKLQKQADKIAIQSFSEALPLPKIRELKDLTLSFNKMSLQIEKNVMQRAQEVETLRKMIYQDSDTGLANLDYVKASTQTVSGRESTYSLVLLYSDQIKSYIDNEEEHEVEQLQASIAEQLKSMAEDSNIIATATPYEFLIIQPSRNPEDLNELATTLLRKVTQIHLSPIHIVQQQARIGIVEMNSSEDLEVTLDKARIAIQENANLKGESISFYNDGQHSKAILRSTQDWRTFAKQAIMNMDVRLAYQNSIDMNGDIVHQEVLAYIEKDGQFITANQFITAIQYQSEGLMFDMHIVEIVLRDLSHAIERPAVTINLTVQSINSQNFTHWLDNKLSSYEHLAHQVFFELPETAFMHENIMPLIEIIRKHGFKFGIDHFGRHFTQMHYLNRFMPHYVKLEHTYTTNLDEPYKGELLSSILRMANTLDIFTIATRIESIEQMNSLSHFQLSGIQGDVTDIVLKEKNK